MKDIKGIGRKRKGKRLERDCNVPVLTLVWYSLCIQRKLNPDSLFIAYVEYMNRIECIWGLHVQISEHIPWRWPHHIYSHGSVPPLPMKQDKQNHCWLLAWFVIMLVVGTVGGCIQAQSWVINGVGVNGQGKRCDCCIHWCLQATAERWVEII